MSAKPEQGTSPGKLARQTRARHICKTLARRVARQNSQGKTRARYVREAAVLNVARQNYRGYWFLLAHNPAGLVSKESSPPSPRGDRLYSLHYGKGQSSSTPPVRPPHIPETQNTHQQERQRTPFGMEARNGISPPDPNLTAEGFIVQGLGFGHQSKRPTVRRGPHTRGARAPLAPLVSHAQDVDRFSAAACQLQRIVSYASRAIFQGILMLPGHSPPPFSLKGW